MYLAHGRFFNIDGKELMLSQPNLNYKDFGKALFDISKAECNNLLEKKDLNEVAICQKDLMIASSCVLLNKANIELGNYRDNVGDCHYEIRLAQKSLLNKFPNFPTNKMDEWLVGLNRSVNRII